MKPGLRPLPRSGGVTPPENPSNIGLRPNPKDTKRAVQNDLFCTALPVMVYRRFVGRRFRLEAAR